MNPIRILHPFAHGFTVISNEFIDTYMPIANGEFVKIYLYLLRNITSDAKTFLLSKAADALNCTEADIIRALKYWEKLGLIQLNLDHNNNLESILFEPTKYDSQESYYPQHQGTKEVAASLEEPSLMESKRLTSQDHNIELEEQPIQKKICLTPDKVKELKCNKEVSQLLFIAQQYLGKTLSSSETNSLLFFYDELHFCADLIEYLIEYCVSKGHKSMRYIEKVAFEWDKQGITSVRMAKDSTSLLKKEYFMVFKALGIVNRNPIGPETKIIDTWINQMGFTMDLIIEACTRTIQLTNQPSLQYVDGILNRWKKNGVKHLQDVETLDIEHKKAAKASAARKQAQAQSNLNSSNTFNNFNQRTYDLNELEKKLLNQ